MTKKIAALGLLLCFLWGAGTAQESYPDRARNYVKQYAQYAIADQRSTGVPASVTLGQGLLETEAGISELVTEANNHFGIKCKNGWQGATFLHDDDAKGECFKKYNNALESYHDHSAHLLRNQRYKILFSYSPTDYARWAHGLKKCGYATNPKYAYQLIKIIEEYHLQEYTYAALDSTYKLDNELLLASQQQSLATTTVAHDTIIKTSASTPAADTVISTTTVTSVRGTAAPALTPAADSVTPSVAADATPLADSSVTLADTSAGGDASVMLVNGKKAFAAHKGDALLPYAMKYKLRYGHLLEINDMPEDPLTADMYIYLEKKNTTGTRSKHQVREGETLLMVAQQECIQLRKLAALNLLKPNENPVTGTVLYLQEPAPSRPEVKDMVLVYDGTATQQEAEPEAASQPVAAAPQEQEVSFGMGFQNPAAAAPQPVAQKQVAETPAPAEEPMAEPVPASKATTAKHVVKKGETAFSIAKRYNVSVDDLAKWNDIKPQSIKVGQTLLIKHI